MTAKAQEHSQDRADRQRQQAEADEAQGRQPHRQGGRPDMDRNHDVAAAAMHQAAPFPAQQQRHHKDQGLEGNLACEQASGNDRCHGKARDEAGRKVPAQPGDAHARGSILAAWLAVIAHRLGPLPACQG